MIRMKKNYCAVVPIDDPDVSPGGIIIPDEAKDRTDQGIVKYVGPDCKYVQPLDYVIYGAYNGQLVQIEGEGRLILLEENFISSTVHHEDIETLEIPGIYYRTKDDSFTTATYETVIQLITRALTNSPIIQDKHRWDVREINPRTKQNLSRVMSETR